VVEIAYEGAGQIFATRLPFTLNPPPIMPRRKASATQARNDDDDGEDFDDVLDEVDEEPAGRKGKGARRSGAAAGGALRQGVRLAYSQLI
jgi:hypothetical protein